MARRDTLWLRCDGDAHSGVGRGACEDLREQATDIACVRRSVRGRSARYRSRVHFDPGGCRAVSAISPEEQGTRWSAATIPADLSRQPDDVMFPKPGEDDPAIIVLSSGTTSLAKGVVHTHRTLMEDARNNLYLYGGIKPSDRTLVPLSTAFIGCYNGWFPFLNAGACTIFMERFGPRFSWRQRLSASARPTFSLRRRCGDAFFGFGYRHRRFQFRAPDWFRGRAHGRRHPEAATRRDQSKRGSDVRFDGKRERGDVHLGRRHEGSAASLASEGLWSMSICALLCLVSLRQMRFREAAWAGSLISSPSLAVGIWRETWKRAVGPSLSTTGSDGGGQAISAGSTTMDTSFWWSSRRYDHFRRNQHRADAG